MPAPLSSTRSTANPSFLPRLRRTHPPSGVKLTTQLPIVLGWGMCRVPALFSRKARANWEMLDLMVTQPHIPTEALARLPMPALVVAGERDMIREGHTRAIAAAIPDSRLAILPGDHFVARRNWQTFTPLVLDFLLDGAQTPSELERKDRDG